MVGGDALHWNDSMATQLPLFAYLSRVTCPILSVSLVFYQNRLKLDFIAFDAMQLSIVIVISHLSFCEAVNFEMFTLVLPLSSLKLCDSSNVLKLYTESSNSVVVGGVANDISARRLARWWSNTISFYSGISIFIVSINLMFSFLLFCCFVSHTFSRSIIATPIQSMCKVCTHLLRCLTR